MWGAVAFGGEPAREERCFPVAPLVEGPLEVRAIVALPGALGVAKADPSRWGEEPAGGSAGGAARPARTYG